MSVFQFMSKRFEKVDLDDLVPSLDCTSEMLQKLRLSLPEVLDQCPASVSSFELCFSVCNLIVLFVSVNVYVYVGDAHNL